MTTKRTLRYGLGAALLLSCSPAALHAETSDKDEKIRRLEAMMESMQHEIRSLKTAVKSEQSEGRRTRRIVAERPVPVAVAPFPEGAVPLFATADKKIQFGAITITPGGFLAAEGVFRSRTQQADISSNYQAIPFGAAAGTNEYRLTARQSRVAVLAEAAITPSMLASGYAELDFLGAGSANANESNSYNPRIRHLYATLDNSDYGMHVLAGQTWSLATMNSKGITPRNEVTPPTIEAQYVPGFVWKRQAQIRLTKDFDKRLWVSLSAEEAQTTFGGTTGCTAGANGTALPGTAGVAAVTCGLTGTGNLNGAQTYSLNHAPDVVGKVAYEAKLADRDVHLEAFGLYRNLYDRVAYTNGSSAQQNTTGFGVGGGLIVPVIPKRLDFQASGLFGRGIGSYGTAQNPDATFSPNGSLSAIKETTALAGLTLHATSAIDIYAFGGFERAYSDYYRNGAAVVNAGGVNTAGAGYTGYGVPNANDNGCSNLGTLGATTCAGNTKQVWQITGGMWDKLYKGLYGEVRVGVQYSYTKRELFQSVFNNISASPKQDEQLVLTSFRYYPFQ